MCKSTSHVLTVDIPRSSRSMFHTVSVSMRWWDWGSVTSSRGRGRRYFTASCRQPHIYDQSWQGGTITHHYPTWTQVIWSINCRYAISIFSNCYHLGIWSTWWRFVTIADHYKPTCVLLIELTQLNLSVWLHYIDITSNDIFIFESHNTSIYNSWFTVRTLLKCFFVE